MINPKKLKQELEQLKQEAEICARGGNYPYDNLIEFIENKIREIEEEEDY